jgi:hypothetical protein
MSKTTGSRYVNPRQTTIQAFPSIEEALDNYERVLDLNLQRKRGFYVGLTTTERATAGFMSNKLNSLNASDAEKEVRNDILMIFAS